MSNLDDIPEFLRMPQPERMSAWKGMRLSKPKAEQRRDWRRPKGWTPEAAALERAILKAEREREEYAKKLRFAKLRADKAEQRAIRAAAREAAKT